MYKVYLLNCDWYEQGLTDAEFVKLAKQHGNELTLEKFETLFNQEMIDCDNFIRIVKEKTMNCYKVFDEELEEICGPEQLKRFAKDQSEELDGLDLESLSDELKEKIEKNREISIDDAFKILELRAFDVEEMEIF